MRKRSATGLLLEAVDKMAEHAAATQSAALAFYSVFSIAPILIVVISFAGSVFGADAARGQIVRQFEGLMGRDAAAAVQVLLQKASGESSGAGLANVAGIATLLIGTTAVFVQLQEALNRIWDVRPRPGSLIASLLRERFVSFALLLAIGFLLLVSLALSAAISVAQGQITRWLPLPAPLLEAGNQILAFLILAGLVALIYRILPDAKVAWSDVALGAVTTSALLSLGKWLIGLYLGRAAVVSPYGAAGSLVVILLWVYYVSFIVLFGAELTRAHARLFRSATVEPSPGAMAATPPEGRA